MLVIYLGIVSILLKDTIALFLNEGLGFHDDLTTPVTQGEAVYIRNLVQSHLNRLLPGAIMEVTGGFRRYVLCEKKKVISASPEK